MIAKRGQGSAVQRARAFDVPAIRALLCTRAHANEIRNGGSDAIRFLNAQLAGVTQLHLAANGGSEKAEQGSSSIRFETSAPEISSDRDSFNVPLRMRSEPPVHHLPNARPTPQCLRPSFAVLIRKLCGWD